MSPKWFMPRLQVCLPMECSRLCSSIFLRFFSQTILLQPSSFCREHSFVQLRLPEQNNAQRIGSQKYFTMWYFLLCQFFHWCQCVSSCASRLGAARAALRHTAKTPRSSMFKSVYCKKQKEECQFPEKRLVFISWEKRHGCRKRPLSEPDESSPLSRQRRHLATVQEPNTGHDSLNATNEPWGQNKVHKTPSAPVSCGSSSTNLAGCQQRTEPVCVCAESRDLLRSRRAGKRPGHRNYRRKTARTPKPPQENEKESRTAAAAAARR